MGWALVFSPGGGPTMAVSEELEKLHCACGALLLRVNAKGVEVAACNHVSVPPSARKITSCIFMARSTAAAR